MLRFICFSNVCLKNIKNTDFLKKHQRYCRATGEHWRALASTLSSNCRALASTGEQLVMLGELLIQHVFNVFWFVLCVFLYFACYFMFCMCFIVFAGFVLFLRRYAKNNVRTVAIDVLGYFFPCGLFFDES